MKQRKPKSYWLTQAKTFLDKFHYLSGHKHSATIYIGAFNRDVLVGCWLFQKNSSDSRTWEWSRAAWNHDFTAWNPHQRALNFFLENIKECGSLITFSENRLFTGAMYSKLGFCLEKTLPPDYCYTNGIVRKHKFLFRVQASTSEIDNAAAHNFYRLWDCGKKKWRFNI